MLSLRNRLISRSYLLGISMVLLLNLNATASEHVSINFDILRSYPFAYIDSHGDNVGTFWEYVDFISQKSNINIKKRIVPKARVIAHLKSGQSDAAILFKTDSLNDHVEYIEKVRTIPIIIATQKGTLIENYEDLKQLKSVGIFRSGAINPEFDNDNSIHKQAVSSYPSLVKMLGIKRLDAIAGNGVVITALINQLCLQDTIDISPLIMGNREQWLVFSKKSAHLNQAEKLNNAIQDLKSEGVLDNIFDAHLSQNQHKCKQ